MNNKAPSIPVSPKAGDTSNSEVTSFKNSVYNTHFIVSQGLFLALGVLLLVVSHPAIWNTTSPLLWNPFFGVGLVLVIWQGWRIALFVGIVVGVISWIVPYQFLPYQSPFAEALIGAGELLISWWAYQVLAQGQRRVNDPRSATIFLLLVPGLILAGCSCFRAWLGPPDEFWSTATFLWISRAVGVLAIAPISLFLLTPLLVKFHLIPVDPHEGLTWIDPTERLTLGDALEVVGLVLGGTLLGLILSANHMVQDEVNWHLWAILLLIVVWASLRQGLRGGSLTATSAAVAALVSATEIPFPISASIMSLQGNLLALCSVALLVGASSGWLRTSETRYRQIIGHIPVVLYSARIRPSQSKKNLADAQVILVSAACQKIFGCPPHHLLGSFRKWLERVHPKDRELVTAALSQLCLQKQPVNCEYRLNPETLAGETETVSNRSAITPLPNAVNSPIHKAPPQERWVRETMAPHYSKEGRLEGWEGVVKDITTQRLLAYDLQRTTTMLHTLVSHLPAGVFFVQGKTGQPILVNMRARQLLGQREDFSAGITHWPRIYRLHRPDGTLYPWEELPVYKALHQGVTSMRDDIVIHRADGRHLPLVTWAAPIELESSGGNVSAVWVFEDLTTLHQAEAARLESEARLRTIIETMAEGLVIQDSREGIIECNPVACSILDTTRETLSGKSSFCPESGILREDGSPFPREEHPDFLCLQTRKPVHNVIMGIPVASEPSAPEPIIRWILVNSIPLVTGQTGRSGFLLRVITTFSDITIHRQTLACWMASERKYRQLVENLPLMFVQFDGDQKVLYANPLSEHFLGQDFTQSSGPELWPRFVHPEDLAAFLALVEDTLKGTSGRVEFRLLSKERKEHFCYAMSNPLQQEETVVGGTLVIVDRTRRRRLEEELNRVQRLELVGRLASGIAHDFNNFLTVIVALCSTLQNKYRVDESLLAYLQTIHSASQEAAHLAAQLLTFSKQRKIQLRPIEVNQIIERTMEMLRSNLPQGIDLSASLSEQSLEILADEGQLQQVVMNLCLNAREAMPGGGRLTVQTRQESGLPDHLANGQKDSSHKSSSASGNWLCLSIQDTGEGIEPQNHNKIFEPFFSTKERGTGLGLAVVRQIVESFAGYIDLRSQPAQGTRFDIWLPLWEEDADETAFPHGL